MSIVRSIVTACLLCSATVFAVNVDLTAPAFLDDFNDALGDAPNQNCIGAVYGAAKLGGAWEGKGYWYIFADDASAVKNRAGEMVEASTNEETMVPDSTLDVTLETSNSGLTYPYAGVGCNLIGDGSDYLDLSKMTGISLKVKGSGKVRLRFETKDIEDADGTWGWYGSVITLTSDWKTVTITADSLKPEEGFTAAKTWKFSTHGAVKINKFAFQVANKTDAHLQVDDIKLVGMTYGDIKFPVVNVISNKVVKGPNMFNVNASSIYFKLAQAQDLTVSLNDVMGNKIRSLYAGKTASEMINLNDKNLASGRYLVVISGKNLNYNQSIVIMK
jgi:hypothetical protein